MKTIKQYIAPDTSVFVMVGEHLCSLGSPSDPGAGLDGDAADPFNI